MYLVCDFNGRWLKDSCSCDVMNEEGRIIEHVQVGCFLKLVVKYFL
jgi:hypothetical protein